jgi:hypothetical protein
MEIELNAVRQRIFNLDSGSHFVFTVTASGKRFLLNEVTDMRMARDTLNVPLNAWWFSRCRS